MNEKLFLAIEKESLGKTWNTRETGFFQVKINLKLVHKFASFPNSRKAPWTPNLLKKWLIIFAAAYDLTFISLSLGENERLAFARRAKNAECGVFVNEAGGETNSFIHSFVAKLPFTSAAIFGVHLRHCVCYITHFWLRAFIAVDTFAPHSITEAEQVPRRPEVANFTLFANKVADTRFGGFHSCGRRV